MPQMKKSRQHYISYSVMALQGPSSRQDQLAPQGQSVLSYPQGTNSVEDTSLEGKPTFASILSSTAISKIQLDSAIKNSLTSALRQEAPYSQVLVELEGERGKQL